MNKTNRVCESDVHKDKIIVNVRKGKFRCVVIKFSTLSEGYKEFWFYLHGELFFNNLRN
jgi:hypothetical protein